MDSHDQRAHGRTTVTIFIGSDEQERTSIRGITRNVSLGGLYVETLEAPPVGSPWQVAFVWDDHLYPTNTRVVRLGKRGVGLAFLDPDDLRDAAILEMMAPAQPASDSLPN